MKQILEQMIHNDKKLVNVRISPHSFYGRWGHVSLVSAPVDLFFKIVTNDAFGTVSIIRFC